MRISDWSSDVCSSDLSAAKPCVTSDDTAPESLDTNPLKPQVSRSTSVSSQALPDAGTPLSGMYAPMLLPAPASTAALNSGRSEERRGGKEGVSQCRSRGSPYH